MGPSPHQLARGIREAIKNYKQSKLKVEYPTKKLEWIRYTASAIIDFLETEVIKFNNNHPYDKISANDLISSVSTALNLLLKAAGTLKKKD
jgi:hypothetical protein